MRPLSQVPRAFPAHLRALQCRPSTLSPRQFFPQQAVRWASQKTGHKSDGNAGQGNDANTGPSGNPSGSRTSGRTLLASALAAGVGYAYAATSGQSQSLNSKQPQYGSAKDFEKVGNCPALPCSQYI